MTCSEVASRYSSSLAVRRYLPSQANVLSTTHRRGTTANRGTGGGGRPWGAHVRPNPPSARRTTSTRTPAILRAQAASRSPVEPWPAQTRANRGSSSAARARSTLAPSRSPTLAGLTHAVNTVPKVSTSRWRLMPRTFIGTVVAVQPSAVGGPQALGVDDARGGLEVAAYSFALPLPQAEEDLLPAALDAPLSPVVVDGLPGWEIVGQQPPGAPGPHPVGQSIDDLAPLMQRGAPAGLGLGDERGDQLPLGIRQISGIGGSIGHDSLPRRRVLLHSAPS